MKRKTLKEKFKDILINTSPENPLICVIDLNGLKCIKIFQIDNDIIYFYIEDDCLITFDDVTTEILELIINEIKWKHL